MDILNFISWIKRGRRIKTAPKESLLAVGVPTVARDDKYITGASPIGLGFNLYNANPAIAGLNNWDGALYVYYELYTIN